MNTRPMALMTSTSAPFAALNRPAPRPGAPLGKLIGLQQAVMALDEDERLALVPDMIAGGHHIGAGVEKLGQDLLRDAEAAGGVLAIDHDEIGAIALAQSRQFLDDRRSGRSGRPRHRETQSAYLPPIQTRRGIAR